MDHRSIIAHIVRNRDVIEALTAGLDDEAVRWRPSPEKWTILEAVNHLYDEEREDFRYRLRSVLDDPNRPWPDIAPADWVTERGYADRDFVESVTNFLHEREASSEWLLGLREVQWELAYDHPLLGPMSAEKILANWLAHDFLHLRQILSLRHGFLTEQTRPVSLSYAGAW